MRRSSRFIGYRLSVELARCSSAELTFPTFLLVEVLKNLTYYAIIRSPGMQVVEYRGKDIVTAPASSYRAARMTGDRTLQILSGAQFGDRSVKFCRVFKGKISLIEPGVRIPLGPPASRVGQYVLRW
jgi:hypothetical protein